MEAKRRGFLNVKGLKRKIKNDLTCMPLINVESSIGKMAKMIQTLVNNSKISK